MKRLVLTVLTASVLALFGEQQAHAQFGYYAPPATSPYFSPPISPYLNILRGGIGGAGINYYTLTVPQFQTAGSLMQLQDQTNLLSTQQQLLLGQSGLFGQGFSGQGLFGQGFSGQGLYGQGLVGSGLVGSGLVAPGLLNAGLLNSGLLTSGLGAGGLTNGLGGLGGLTTGHPVLFGTTGFYFNSQPVRGLQTVPR